MFLLPFFPLFFEYHWSAIGFSVRLFVPFSRISATLIPTVSRFSPFLLPSIFIFQFLRRSISFCVFLFFFFQFLLSIFFFVPMRNSVELSVVSRPSLLSITPFRKVLFVFYYLFFFFAFLSFFFSFCFLFFGPKGNSLG